MDLDVCYAHTHTGPLFGIVVEGRVMGWAWRWVKSQRNSAKKMVFFMASFGLKSD